MCILTSSSKLLLNHKNLFINNKIIVSGDIQDLFPVYLHTKNIQVYTLWYHQYKKIAYVLGSHIVHFGIVSHVKLINNYDTLLYFWTKNKLEAMFQLTNLLAYLTPNCNIFIVGEIRSGIRSTIKILKDYCQLSKIDNAKHCIIYYGQLNYRPYFNINDYWRTYCLNNIKIKTLPGVFGVNGLDDGSKLLLSTFQHSVKGNIADIGCGSGVLSAVLAHNSKNAQFTLSDSHMLSLMASHATFKVNKLHATILASDVFSNIKKRFNIIISNPSSHCGIHFNLKMLNLLIYKANNYLFTNGELRIVINKCFPCLNLLKQSSNKFQILAHNNRFIVYQMINKR